MMNNPKNQLFIKIAGKADIDELDRERSDFGVGGVFPINFSEDERIFIARHRNRIVGYIKIGLLPNGAGRIQSLYVRDGYTSLGIGRKLVGAANASFIRHKVNKASLKSDSNSRTLKFYENHTNYKNVDWTKPLEFEWRPVRNPRPRRNVG